MIGRTCTLNDAKARAELGYAPVVSVSEGLAGLAQVRTAQSANQKRSPPSDDPRWPPWRDSAAGTTGKDD